MSNIDFLLRWNNIFFKILLFSRFKVDNCVHVSVPKMEINYNPGFSPVLIVIKPPSSHKMRSVGRREVSHMICSENLPSSKGADLFFVPKRKIFFCRCQAAYGKEGSHIG